MATPINSPRNPKSGMDPSSVLLILMLVIFYLRNSNSSAMSSRTTAMKHSAKYFPSHLEKEIMKVSKSVLGYDQDMVDECDLHRNASKKVLHSEYIRYLANLEKFADATRKFNAGVKDLRLLSKGKRNKLCQNMDKVLQKSFHTKRDCSWTNAGYVEPLLPPMRHPRLCDAEKRELYKLNIEYLVHDFGTICRRLERDTRTVFFDLGASLQVHGNINPALSLIQLYSRFGIEFDHYYAFEYTYIEPKVMFGKVPDELLNAYHWYNVPVETSPDSKQNPWKALLSKLSPNDLVVIKVDIDTASVELPLVRQLLQDKYARLVDHVYFEHHVRMKELTEKNWGEISNGTLQDSLDLFTSLRQAGMGAHSWV